MFTPGIWRKRQNDDGTWRIETNDGVLVAFTPNEGDADLIRNAQDMYDLIRELFETRCMNNWHHEQASRVISRVAGSDVSLLV